MKEVGGHRLGELPFNEAVKGVTEVRKLIDCKKLAPTSCSSTSYTIVNEVLQKMIGGPPCQPMTYSAVEAGS